MVTFSFSVHTITEAKQYAGLGRAEPGAEPGRWIFQPGHLARLGVAPPLLSRCHCLTFALFLQGDQQRCSGTVAGQHGEATPP